MPSSHRRIGVVVDPPVEEALALLRSRQSQPEAGLARGALFEAAALKEVRRAAAGRGRTAEDATRLISELLALLDDLDLPEPVRVHLAGELNESIVEAGDEARRERQLQMLRTPNRYGDAVVDLTEEFDELERAAG